MPLGKYKDFAACKKAKTAELGAKRAKKYCGALFWKVHGKKEGSKKLRNELKELNIDIEKYHKKFLSDTNAYK